MMRDCCVCCVCAACAAWLFAEPTETCNQFVYDVCVMHILCCVVVFSNV